MKQIITAITVGTILIVLILLALFNPTIPVLMFPKDSTVAKDSSSVDPVDWSPVENQSFVIDMEKMNVVLIKRTINDGREVTLIRYQSGSDEYFACSKEVHEELVKKFQEIINKRESGN
jgi:hypothetical protein